MCVLVHRCACVGACMCAQCMCVGAYVCMPVSANTHMRTRPLGCRSAQQLHSASPSLACLTALGLLCVSFRAGLQRPLELPCETSACPPPSTWFVTVHSTSLGQHIDG